MADEPDLPIPEVQASKEVSLPDPALPTTGAPAFPPNPRSLGSNPIHKGTQRQ